MRVESPLSIIISSIKDILQVLIGLSNGFHIYQNNFILNSTVRQKIMLNIMQRILLASAKTSGPA